MSQSPCDDDDGDDGDAEPVPAWNAFSRDGTAELPPPGPELAALTGRGRREPRSSWTRRQMLGAGSAARRLQAHADYLEIVAVAEFGRLRLEQLEASKARGDRVRSRDGEYPAEELGFEMTASAYSAAVLLDMALNIVGPAAGHPRGDGGRGDRPGPGAGHQQRHPAPARRPGRGGRQGPRGGRAGDAGRGPGRRRPPGSRPAWTPRACRSARTRRGMTGGWSCAGRTRGRRACRGGSWTRPRRWRGRRRSTPRRSGSATRACPAPWPRSGR